MTINTEILSALEETGTTLGPYCECSFKKIIREQLKSSINGNLYQSVLVDLRDFLGWQLNLIIERSTNTKGGDNRVQNNEAINRRQIKPIR